MKWVTKKQLRAKITSLETEVNRLNKIIKDKDETIDEYQMAYPFKIGQTVYDIQLRNNKGRFTKKNPSKTYSMINEVVVDTKNYFSLVERYKNSDVFTVKAFAEKYIDTVCVE